VFDLDALILSESGPNDALGMDRAEALRNSPLNHLPDKSCPLILGFGEPELEEFKRQSRGFAHAWRDAGLEVTVIEVPDAHHFAMSREIHNPESEIFRAVTEMIGA
jgi:arylformamidase